MTDNEHVKNKGDAFKYLCQCVNDKRFLYATRCSDAYNGASVAVEMPGFANIISLWSRLADVASSQEAI